jgi:hypothetical protein
MPLLEIENTFLLLADFDLKMHLDYPAKHMEYTNIIIQVV